MEHSTLLILLTIGCSVESLSTPYPTQDNTAIARTDVTGDKLRNVTGRTRVYLDDVLFAMRNMDWTDEEQPCLRQTIRMLHGLQNYTLWAVWEWDSILSQPLGLLYGSKYHLGNFDECLELPWYDTHPDLRTQYCLADIYLERTDKAVKHRINMPLQPYQSVLDVIEIKNENLRNLQELIWGICVPEVCTTSAVEKLLKIMLTRSHLGSAGLRPHISVKEECQRANSGYEYNGAFYGFFGIVFFFTAICLISTYFNSRLSRLNSFASNVMKCFCLRTNTVNLMKESDEGLNVFYGIRYLTMVVIVLHHMMGIFSSGAITNGFEVNRKYKSVVGLFLLHNDLSVDSFFLLSGFLTAIAFNKFKRFPNPLMLILKRYLRLMPAFALVILYMAGVMEHTGSGPLWMRGTGPEVRACQQNWWTSALMVGNYVNVDNICMVIAWYIPCDFHFFVITTLVYWLYCKWPKLGLTGSVVVSVVGFIMPGIIVYMYNLPPVQLFTYDFVRNPRVNVQYRTMYVTSHTRMGSYTVGVVSGFLYARLKSTGNLKRWSPVKASCLAVVALAVMLGTAVMGSLYYWRHYSVLEACIYACFDRPIWALALVLLVFSCTFGRVPLIAGFLSCKAWVPLSRLAYGLYLTHVMFTFRSVFSAREPQKSDFTEHLISTMGITVLGSIVAYVMFVLVEAPVNNLVVLALKTQIKQQPKSGSESQISPSTSSAQQLHDNMVSTFSVSSKI